jgi:Na+-transporting NADH:ubiquinone oxidoreductase subunit F
MIVAALLFINGFALAIGLLTFFLDRVISNYGTCTITINGDKSFDAQGGKSLLKTLQENRYFIPSACGGKGTCGYCRLKVGEGGGQALATESLILSRTEVAAGFRLACQLKVRNNLAIAVPPEYLEIKEYAGTVERTERLTSDIRRIVIRIPPPETISYKPGQYVQVKVPGGSEYRAYSMASTPDRTDAIELNVKLIPDGLGSTYLHGLAVGDPVSFSGPYGEFYLRQDSARTIVCVAGGVGLAPLKSIVSFWASRGMGRPLELYYGSRSIADLYDHEEFVRLAAERPRFRYWPALTTVPDAWTGETGFVHTVVERRLADGVDGEAYLCGPPIMIDAVKAVLRAKGIPEERILYDKF